MDILPGTTAACSSMKAAAFLEVSTRRELAPVSLTAAKVMSRAGRKHTEPADVRKLARARVILAVDGLKRGARVLDMLLPVGLAGQWLDILVALVLGIRVTLVRLVQAVRVRDTPAALARLVLAERARRGLVERRDIPLARRLLMRRRAVIRQRAAVVHILRPAADIQQAEAVDMLPRVADMRPQRPMRRRRVAATKVSNL